MDNYTIYGLIDPRNQQLRYIGQTVCLRKRLIQHLWFARTGREKGHKAAWIRQMLSAGTSFEVIELEVCSFDTVDESEAFWIGYLRSIGCQLTNATDGGGGRKGYALTQEAKDRIGRGNKGLKRSLETRQKMSQWLKEHPMSPQARAKQGAALRGRPCPEHVKAALRNRVVSKETRDKLSRQKMKGDILDQYGNVYRDVRDAAEKIGVNPSTISKALLGKRSSVKGHVLCRAGI